MRYRFTHPFPKTFLGLIHGLNAVVHSGDGRVVPESTVTLHPGDTVDLLNPDDPHHDHAFLEPVPTEEKPAPRQDPLPDDDDLEDNN